MYERYAGLIFDMDGTILDTEPTHRKAWREVLGHYGLQYDVQAMIALNGSPTWRIAQAIIELNQADLDPHALAREKTEAVRSMLLDSVEPLPLVEVVKSWHGRRPMAVGTGVKAPSLRHCWRTWGYAIILTPSSLPITSNIINLRQTHFCCARSVWACNRRSVWSLKMPISVFRRPVQQVWTPWMFACCE